MPTTDIPTPIDTAGQTCEGLPAKICSARFLADYPDHMDMHVVANAYEARQIIAGFTDDMRACCCYDHSADVPKKGDIVFLAEHLDAPLIVHECVHAACCWTIKEEMTKATADVSEEEMQAHYEEVLARVTEQLCADAFADLLNA